MGTPVIDLLRARQGGASDDAKIGLVVEGGGIRGVATAAMLVALKDMGYLPLFDYYLGCSSGALNLDAMARGGGWPELSTYYTINNPGGLRRRVTTPGRPLLRMEALRESLWVVSRNELEFDYSFVCSNLTTLSRMVVDARTAGSRVGRYLLAGAWIPHASGKLPEVDGDRLCDGYVLCPEPVELAFESGCTHVVQLTPSVREESSQRQAARMANAVVLASISPRLAAEYSRLRFRTRAPDHGDRLHAFSACLDLKELPYFARERAQITDGLAAGYAAIYGSRL